MTANSNFSTIKFALSTFIWHFPRRNSVFGRFPLCPQCSPPPSKDANFNFYCRLAISDSPPGTIVKRQIALTPTAKLQQLRANSREMTTFAEFWNDREMQRP